MDGKRTPRNKLLKVLAYVCPGSEFFKNWVSKLLSTLISVKVHILLWVTYFFYSGRLSEDNWTKIIISIALGNVAIHLITRYKNGSSIPPSS